MNLMLAGEQSFANFKNTRELYCFVEIEKSNNKTYPIVVYKYDFFLIKHLICVLNI